MIRGDWPEYIGKRFSAGTVVITVGAREALTDHDVRIALVQHITGRWGDVCEHDAAINEEALRSNGRILSVYHSASGVKFYVITEADRQHTVVLLPEEY